MSNRFDRIRAMRALRRAEEHAAELFVADETTSTITLWNDTDFRVEVYGGLDTRRHDVHHGEQVKYTAFDGRFVYANFTREFGWHTDRCLKEYVIEEWP